LRTCRKINAIKLKKRGTLNIKLRLCDFFIVHPPQHGTTFFSAQLGGGAVNVRWERHSRDSEFSTYWYAFQHALVS
jgi:hypothetical protein